MFVPIQDDNPLESIRFQYVTVGLIIINVVVYLLSQSTAIEAMAASFAIVPSELLKVGYFGGPAFGPLDTLPVPERYTLISYMFLHGDPIHLIGNMLFLWVFGDNVEDAMGHFRFVIFYLACGVFAGLAHTWMLPSSEIPLIGASGAVSGVIAAYLLLHPRVNIWVLFLKFIPLQITAALALGAWVIMQFVMLVMPSTGLVAWWAHIGGLAAGAVLILFMRRAGVPLLDRGLKAANP